MVAMIMPQNYTVVGVCKKIDSEARVVLPVSAAFCHKCTKKHATLSSKDDGVAAAVYGYRRTSQLLYRYCHFGRTLKLTVDQVVDH